MAVVLPTAGVVAAAVVGSGQVGDIVSKPSKDSIASKASANPTSGGKNNAWLTAGIIIADVVGAGILGMPTAVASFGWLLGAVIMVVMLAANVHISILLWRVRVGCPACSSVWSFADLAKGAFAQAPTWQQHAIYGVTVASQMIFLFGLMGVYLLTAGKGLGMMFYTSEVCLPYWTALAAGVLLPFALTAREMGAWQSLVYINIGALTCTILISLSYFVGAGVESVRPEGSNVVPFSNLDYDGVLSGLSTLTFGMTSQFMLTEIIAEMKDPMEFPKAYAYISAPFQLAIFLLAGLGGYFFIGDKVKGMINDNLSFGPAFQAAACCLVVNMLISRLIKGVVFCKFIQTKADKEYSDSSDNRCRSWLSWHVLVLITLVLSWLLANVVPFFVAAVDLLGASFTPLSCWMIPIVLFVRWYLDTPEEGRPRVSKLEWVVMVSEFVFAFSLMIFGTISTVQTIIGEWHTYGAPFACHCEGLWNTCECSASKLLETCGAAAGL